MSPPQMSGIVEQWGEDLAIRLTAPFAKATGLVAGMRITVEAVRGGVMVRRVNRSSDTLAC